MSWASRRRLVYVTMALTIVLAALAFIAYAIFYEAPTCFDGAQNGDEAGVDCGGTCERICSFSAAPIEVLFSRSIPLAGNLYSAVAVLENPNARAIARNVEYTIKMRDAEGLLVAEEVGQIDIPAQREIPLFVHTIDTGLRTPIRTDLEITSTPVWERVDSAPRMPRVAVESLAGNRVTAVVTNPYLVPLTDLTFVAFVRDTNGTVIAASQSKLTYLDAEANETIVFTWPTALDLSAVSADVIVRTPLSWDVE